MWEEHRVTILRWVFGIGAFGVSFRLSVFAYENLDFGLFFFALVLLVAGLIAVWESLFALATRPFFAMVDSIFFPGGKLSKPTLNLKLPRYYIRERRYDEALDEYEKILKHYRDETEAYEGAIWLYEAVFEEPCEAEKIRSRARRRHLVLDSSEAGFFQKISGSSE